MDLPDRQIIVDFRTNVASAISDSGDLKNMHKYFFVSGKGSHSTCLTIYSLIII